MFDLLKQQCEGINIEDYINFFCLYTHGTINGVTVSSQIYVHSKIMIVDDNVMIIGSQNLNERSLLGSRDSELSVKFYDDAEKVEVKFGDKIEKVNKFVHRARLDLWKEHLQVSEDQILDPTDDVCYHEIWLARAKKNTQIFDEVFPGKPQDAIIEEKDFHPWLSPRNVEKLEHVKGQVILFPLGFFSHMFVVKMFSDMFT